MLSGNFTAGASMTATAFGLSRIHQIAVVVHDIRRAVVFYRDVLGMKLLFEIPPNLAFFDAGGVRLMLSLPSAPEFDHPGSIIYFHVDEIQEAARELKTRGVVFDEAPHIVGQLPHADVWLATFKDPDGNVLALMSEARRS
jgi:methylmalonyl-CoA/ethylmalonyl-CoA epimerase